MKWKIIVALIQWVQADCGDWIIGTAYPTCIILCVQVLGNFIHGRHVEN